MSFNLTPSPFMATVSQIYHPIPNSKIPLVRTQSEPIVKKPKETARDRQMRKNREAALRCRQKKINTIEKLKEEINKSHDQNSKLDIDLEILRAQVADLREVLASGGQLTPDYQYQRQTVSECSANYNTSESLFGPQPETPQEAFFYESTTSDLTRETAAMSMDCYAQLPKLARPTTLDLSAARSFRNERFPATNY